MKSLKTILVLALTAFSFSALADFTTIPKDMDDLAMKANDVFSVTNLKIGDTAFKIVSMDTRANGDLSATTMVLVGENGVGGAAGYEGAFLVGPEESRNSLKSAKRQGGVLVLTFYNFDGGTTKLRLRYDKANNTLVELK